MVRLEHLIPHNGVGALLVSIGIFSSSLANTRATAGQAAPDAPNEVLLTRGPYLQLRAPTSILVRWRTDVSVDSRVRCGTNPADLNLSFTDPALTTEHQVGLANLQPATRYYYSIGSGTAELAGGTDIFFITAPRPDESRRTRVWFVSDYGFGDENEAAVRDAYLNLAAASGPADVWLTGGDNDQIAGDDADLQVSVFGIYAPLLRNLALWPTIGNHDTYTLSVPGPYPYFDNFTLPTLGEAGGTASGSEHYYSFDHGGIHFISLDSIDPALSDSANTPMLRWLREDLANTAQPWKIAFWHGPPYTKGSHDSDDPGDTSARMIQMRENVVPTVEAYGVDLVLCGHSHVYERSSLLFGHYGDSSTFSESYQVDGGNGREGGDGAYRQVNGRGTVYVVAGVGGYPYDFWYGSHPAHLVNIGTELGSCVVDVNGNRLDFQFINTNTEVLDHFSIIKDLPLRIVSRRFTTNFVTLTWNSLPAARYLIEQARVLPGPWVPASGPILTSGTLTSWSSNLPRGAPNNFYRVTRLPD